MLKCALASTVYLTGGVHTSLHVEGLDALAFFSKQRSVGLQLQQDLEASSQSLVMLKEDGYTGDADESEQPTWSLLRLTASLSQQAEPGL